MLKLKKVQEKPAAVAETAIAQTQPGATSSQRV